MSTLYRDYRPQDFSEIFGQNHIRITLQNEIEADKLSQAYLFCGPRAVGKTTLARILAKAANCTNRKKGSYEPCNKCESCLSITMGRNLDVVEIDAASNTGVDNVRENIIAFSRLAPSNSKYKVFIIDEIHMLSISAFNSLLKIIEEPPKYVIFVLCTTEVHKVPLTIISRCERFDFQRISVSDVVKKLSHIASSEKVEIDKEVLEAVARRSDGHLRDAESLLGQIFSLGDKKITLEQAELVLPHYNSNEALQLLDLLSKKDAAKAIALVNNLVDNGVNTRNFIGEIVNLLRKIMLSKLNPTLNETLGLNLGESLEIKLNEVANNLNWEQVIKFTRSFLEVYNDSRSPLISQLPLEIMITEICLGVDKAPMVPKEVINAPKDVLPKKTAAKTSVSTAVKKNSNKTVVNLKQGEVLEKWPEFLVKIKKYNHSLSFVLQNCQPQQVKDGELCLTFKYKFHQDRVNNSAIKEIVENTLAEVFGGSLSINSSVDENLELVKETNHPEEASGDKKEEASVKSSQKEKPQGLMSDLLKTFGGEIIN